MQLPPAARQPSSKRASSRSASSTGVALPDLNARQGQARRRSTRGVNRGVRRGSHSRSPARSSRAATPGWPPSAMTTGSSGGKVARTLLSVGQEHPGRDPGYPAVRGNRVTRQRLLCVSSRPEPAGAMRRSARRPCRQWRDHLATNAIISPPARRPAPLATSQADVERVSAAVHDRVCR